MSASPVRSVVRNALDGRLPERYQAGAAQWRHLFDIHAREAYRPGMDVLDVGAGRKPSLPRDMRSGGGRYVGLDIDPSELGRAVDGAYEETLAADICVFQPELEGCFDLALSLFLLEHVHSVPAAVENVWRYLRPGGKVVAQLAGARSLHGLVNRAIPHRLARQIAYVLPERFIGGIERPDVDKIEGLSPSISIEQKTISHNPRSTVGTVTEIYDFLRLLFAKCGTQHCTNCNQPVQRQTVEQMKIIIAGMISKRDKGRRVQLSEIAP